MPTIQAAVCHAFGEPLRIEQLRLDGPGDGEIGVRIKACAICHSDISHAEGAWGSELPMVLGHEASGIVTDVGAGVRGFARGDHVVVTLIRSCGHCHYCDQGRQVHCETDLTRPQGGPLHLPDGRAVRQAMQTGAFAEAVTVHASQAVVVPPEVPFASGALLACGVITGCGAVTRSAGVEAGQSVAVIGCGGVGLNALQAARLAGAHPIIAVDPQAAKRQAAQRFGATDALDPSSADLVRPIRALTGGRGADHVLVTVGAKSALDSAVPLLARGGTMTAVGMPPAGVMASYEATNLIYYGQRIQGSIMGASRIRRDIPELVKLYRSGRLMLDELVTDTYPLERINEAIAAVKGGNVLRNVIVFD